MNLKNETRAEQPVCVCVCVCVYGLCVGRGVGDDFKENYKGLMPWFFSGPKAS